MGPILKLPAVRGGILYVDSVLYARSERWAHAWELKLGVVGPASQADNVQKDFHELIGGVEPMGWDTQLPDEPVINVGLTTAHLWAEGNAGGSAKWRLVPVGHVGLGVFEDGRSVDTKPFVGNVSLGMAVRHGGFALSMATTFSTDAFETQEESAEFGALSASWYF